MKNFYYAFCCFALVTILTGCSTKSENVDRQITKAEYGEQWAFTVDSLALKCDNDAVIAFDDKGNKYYVNGVAKSKYQNNSSYKDIAEIQLDDDVINEILKKSSNGEPFVPMKKSISFAIDEGIKLCK